MFSSFLSSWRRKPDFCNTLFIIFNTAQIHYAKLPHPDMGWTLVMRHLALHCPPMEPWPSLAGLVQPARRLIYVNCLESSEENIPLSASCQRRWELRAWALASEDLCWNPRSTTYEGVTLDKVINSSRLDFPICRMGLAIICASYGYSD